MEEIYRAGYMAKTSHYARYVAKTSLPGPRGKVAHQALILQSPQHRKFVSASDSRIVRQLCGGYEGEGVEGLQEEERNFI